MKKAVRTLAVVCSMALFSAPAAHALRQTELERVDAVVSIELGEAKHLFAVRELRPRDWSHVPRAPYVLGGGSTTLTAFTEAAAIGKPVLVVAKAQSAAPKFSFATQIVNSGPEVLSGDAIEHLEAHASSTWCESESGIAGFFVENVGPTPTTTAALVLRQTNGTSQLDIDPSRAVVPGAPDLMLTPGDFQNGSSEAGRASIHVSAASDAAGSVVLAFTRRGDRWQGFGGPIGADGYYSSLSWDPTRDGPIEEWRFYFLTTLAAC